MVRVVHVKKDVPETVPADVPETVPADLMASARQTSSVNATNLGSVCFASSALILMGARDPGAKDLSVIFSSPHLCRLSSPEKVRTSAKTSEQWQKPPV